MRTARRRARRGRARRRPTSCAGLGGRARGTSASLSSKTTSASSPTRSALGALRRGRAGAGTAAPPADGEPTRTGRGGRRAARADRRWRPRAGRRRRRGIARRARRVRVVATVASVLTTSARARPPTRRSPAARRPRDEAARAGLARDDAIAAASRTVRAARPTATPARGAALWDDRPRKATRRDCSRRRSKPREREAAIALPRIEPRGAVVASVLARCVDARGAQLAGASDEAGALDGSSRVRGRGVDAESQPCARGVALRGAQTAQRARSDVESALGDLGRRGRRAAPRSPMARLERQLVVELHARPTGRRAVRRLDELAEGAAVRRARRTRRARPPRRPTTRARATSRARQDAADVITAAQQLRVARLGAAIARATVTPCSRQSRRSLARARHRRSERWGLCGEAPRPGRSARSSRACRVRAAGHEHRSAEERIEHELSDVKQRERCSTSCAS